VVRIAFASRRLRRRRRIADAARSATGPERTLTWPDAEAGAALSGTAAPPAAFPAGAKAFDLPDGFTTSSMSANPPHLDRPGGWFPEVYVNVLIT